MLEQTHRCVPLDWEGTGQQHPVKVELLYYDTSFHIELGLQSVNCKGYEVFEENLFIHGYPGKCNPPQSKF